MQCAVWNCVNERKDKEARKSFFVFPKNHKLREKWLDFCGRPAGFKPNTWRICMDHFKKEDIIGDLAFEMGLRGKRSLKAGAVPCIYNDVSSITEEERKKLQKKEKRARRKNNAPTMKEDNFPTIITLNTGVIIRKLPPNAEIPGRSSTNVTKNNVAPKTAASNNTNVTFMADDVKAEIQALQNQIQKLKQENFALQQEMRRTDLRHQYEKYILKQKMEKVELEKKTLQEMLLETLPPEYINIKVNENKRKDIHQVYATVQNMMKNFPGIMHEERVNVEIIDENLEENNENIKQEKLAEELSKNQLLEILPVEEIKKEFIDENLEPDLCQQTLAEQNIMQHLEVRFNEEKIGIRQENIKKTPLEIKSESE